jgi:hypothetical protein
MCLFTNRTKPLVANKDLVVYKELIVKDGKYFTPYRDVEVKLNSYLTVFNTSFIDTSLSGYHEINGEGVHSYTHLTKLIGFKAIIPKGTPFWISSDLKEIASTELYITDKICDEETDLKEICDLLLKENFVKHEENKIILLDKYYISTKYIGKHCNHYLLDNSNIQLFDKEDLQEILSYILYINALLYICNFKLFPINGWYWSKSKYSELYAFRVRTYYGDVNRSYRNSTFCILAESIS